MLEPYSPLYFSAFGRSYLGVGLSGSGRARVEKAARARDARDNPGVERAARRREKNDEKCDGLPRRANAGPAHHETKIIVRRRSGMVYANFPQGIQSEGALRKGERGEDDKAPVPPSFPKKFQQVRVTEKKKRFHLSCF